MAFPRDWFDRRLGDGALLVNHCIHLYTVVGVGKNNRVSVEDLSCDVLVVGSGAAGLCTALAAAKRGLSVTIVEATPLIGGSTAY